MGFIVAALFLIMGALILARELGYDALPADAWDLLWLGFTAALARWRTHAPKAEDVTRKAEDVTRKAALLAAFLASAGLVGACAHAQPTAHELKARAAIYGACMVEAMTAAAAACALPALAPLPAPPDQGAGAAD